VHGSGAGRHRPRVARSRPGRRRRAWIAQAMTGTPGSRWPGRGQWCARLH
jgi:hypothetical protein